MQYSYGSYTHDAGTVFVNVSRRLQLDSAGRPERWVVAHNIQGEVFGADTATLAAKVAALIGAYSQNNSDATLSGSVHSLANASTIGGTRVTALEFPAGQPGEWATRVPFRAVVEGEVWADDVEDVIAFEETVDIDPGEAAYVWTRPIEGKPKSYQTAEQGIWTITQRGSAVGRLSYPTSAVPGPVVSGAGIVSVGPRISLGQPVRSPRGLSDYPLSWEYTITSADEIVATPHTGME